MRHRDDRPEAAYLMRTVGRRPWREIADFLGYRATCTCVIQAKRYALAAGEPWEPTYARFG